MIYLLDCEVAGKMMPTSLDDDTENVHNVMIHQSISGDAEEGCAAFTMEQGKLVGNAGDMFYITNTEAEVTLKDVEIINQDKGDNIVFMRVVGNSSHRGWGKACANGANVTFTAEDQTIDGDIVVDGISKLVMKLTGGCVWNGCINVVDNSEGGTTTGDNCTIELGEGVVWNLTGNCVIDKLENNGGTINFNGYKITLADGTVLS